MLSVAPGTFDTHREISSAASHAKKLDKDIEGCSLFLERRFPAEKALPQTVSGGF